MKKHFVTFLSPGTFVAEQTTLLVDSWDVDMAVEMSKEIKERYDATPYGFFFSTRERQDDELDSKTTEQSGTYYLGGEIISLEELRLENNPENKILISNMEINGWNEIVVNKNSWSWTQPLRENDVVLELE